MSDGDAMLATIRADRSDDTVRLGYADWLDENAKDVACPTCAGKAGGNDTRDDWKCSGCWGSGLMPNYNTAKAAWIRTQIRAWHYKAVLGVVPKGVLLGELAWARPDKDPHRYDTSGSAGRGDVTICYPFYTAREHVTQVTYSRGFVESITIPLSLFIQNEAAVVALAVGVINLHAKPTPVELAFIADRSERYGIAFKFNGGNV